VIVISALIGITIWSGTGFNAILFARYLHTVVLVDSGDPRNWETREINGFLVEKDMAGFEAPLMHHKLSLRASVTSELVFRDVRVLSELLLSTADWIEVVWHAARSAMARSEARKQSDNCL
jgi:alkylation response protein AidB-like acyl-CoA dehydrogenase